MNEKEFKSLREELINGNTQSLEFIFNKHAQYCISNLKRRYNCTQEVAEDLFMDAILNFRDKVVEDKLDTVKNVRNYIYTTCTNMYKARVSKEKSQKNKKYDLQNTFYSSHQEDYLTKVIQNQNQEEIKKLSLEAFAQLSDSCQKIIHMFYVQELSMQEIAEILGYSNANVAKTTKARCYKKLLDLLDQIKKQK